MEATEQNFTELHKPTSAYITPDSDSITRVHYLSTELAAEYLGVSAETLKHWRGAGTGPPYRKLPNASIDYRLDHLERFNELHTVDPAIGESLAEAKRQLFVDPNARYKVSEAARLLRQSRQKTYKDIKAGLLKACSAPASSLIFIPGTEIIRVSAQ